MKQKILRFPGVKHVEYTPDGWCIHVNVLTCYVLLFAGKIHYKYWRDLGCEPREMGRKLKKSWSHPLPVSCVFDTQFNIKDTSIISHFKPDRNDNLSPPYCFGNITYLLLKIQG